MMSKIHTGACPVCGASLPLGQGAGMITDRQTEVLEFIVAFHACTGGVSPSLREVARGIGVKSQSHAADLVQQLVERGYLRKLSHRARAIEVLQRPGVQGGPVPVAWFRFDDGMQALVPMTTQDRS